jgi:GMP synthase-like glutamine amidotransferase
MLKLATSFLRLPDKENLRMRAHCLQHVPFEGLGSIATWILNAGYEITCTKFYESGGLPDINGIDLLIVMGGPMSANDEPEYPWLVKEKKFINSVIRNGKPTLGVCLGAQLIANSMGSEVFPNPVKEIGWFPIQPVKTDNESLFQFPGEIDAFHWHGETFVLPEGAVRLAESKGCKNQAFQIGENVIGLQFHLETTPHSAKAIVQNCADELVDGEYIQTREEILSAHKNRYRSINMLMESILEYLHAGSGCRDR